MRLLPVAVAVAACTTSAAAQGVPFSQHGTVSQRVGTTDILVEYNRPVAHGRVLFGPHGVVRAGRAWTAGADSATRISFSRDVEFERHAVPAGRYSLWFVPADSGSWTVILSNAVDVFHLPYPGEAHDVLRVTVMPDSASWMDALAYYFPVVGPDSTVLRMQWGTTVVPIHIRTAAR